MSNHSICFHGEIRKIFMWTPHSYVSYDKVWVVMESLMCPVVTNTINTKAGTINRIIN